MIDERDIIQRAVQLLEPEEPAMDRMLRRRDRKRRNRRARAGIVAVVVSALLITSLRLFDRNDRTVPVSTPSPVAERWMHRAASAGDTTAVASFGGNVYFAGSVGNTSTQRVLISAYDAQGQRLWETRSEPAYRPEVGGLAVDESGVYVSDAGRGLTKYSLDGAEAWSRSQRGTGSWAARTNGLVMDASGLYVYRNAHTLRKYDRDGTLLWSADLGSAIEPGWIGGVGSMVASPSGGVYIGATECQPSADGWCHPPRVDYQVTRVDANGNVLWSTHLPASTRGEFWPFLVPSGDGVVALTSSLACGHAEAQRWERTCMTRLDQLGHRTDHAILRPTDLTWQDPHGSMPGFALPFQDDGVLIGRSAGPGSFELLNYDRTGTLVSSRLVHLGSGSYWPAAAATEGQGLAIAAISWHGGDREIPIVASLPEGAAAP